MKIYSAIAAIAVVISAAAARADSGKTFNDGLKFDIGTVVGDILKKTGQKTMGKVTEISDLLLISAHALATFSHNSGVHEKGETVNNFTLSWTYNRNGDNPASQSIDQGIGARPVADRSYNVVGAGLTADTTYTISAVGDDVSHGAPAGNPSSLQTTVFFRNKRYWCVTPNAAPTDAQIVAGCSSEFGTARQATKTFDASSGTPPNYVSFAYPTAWGVPSATVFNGFSFTDYTVTTIVGFTNASGHAEDYYYVRTNNTYSGAGITWQIQ